MSPARLAGTPALAVAAGGLLRPGGLALTAAAIEGCGLEPGARVLDVGCGPGGTVTWLRREAGLRAVGLDLEAGALRAAGRAGAGPLVRGDGRRLPVRTGSFDLVLLECSLSVTGATGEVLAECRRVLAPGGRLVVTDLVRRAPPAPGAPALALHGRAELCDEVARAGFSIERLEDHSRALAALAARHLLAGGAIEELWACRCGSDGEAGALRAALRAARPGYALVRARAEGGPHG